MSSVRSDGINATQAPPPPASRLTYNITSGYLNLVMLTTLNLAPFLCVLIVPALRQISQELTGAGNSYTNIRFRPFLYQYQNVKIHKIPRFNSKVYGNHV